MNCPNCGSVLPQGAQMCPACGAFLSGAQDYSGFPAQAGGYPQGFDPTAYNPNQRGYAQGFPPQSYGQSGYSQGYDPSGYNPGGYNQCGYQPGFDPTAYSQGYSQQGYNGFPPGYQPVYGRYSAGTGDRGAFLGALSSWPRVISGLLRDPGEALQGMMERNDLFSGSVVAGLTLLFTFLSAIIMVRSALFGVFSGLSGLLGTTLASDAASMSQGVNYIAGKIAVPIGGIAVLCQLFALFFPAAVALVYLCVMRKVRFSFLLASNLVAITTLPTIVASLLCMVTSLLSPYLGIVAIFVGEVTSFVLLCAMIVRATGLPETQAAPTKIAIICISEVLKLLFILLIGGAMMNSTLNTVSSLIGTMGSLL